MAASPLRLRCLKLLPRGQYRRACLFRMLHREHVCARHHTHRQPATSDALEPCRRHQVRLLPRHQLNGYAYALRQVREVIWQVAENIQLDARVEGQLGAAVI